MKKLPSYKLALFQKARAEQQICKDWLIRIMRASPVKTRSKEDLCAEAMRDLKVSKSSFDAAWIGAIEELGYHDWYEPLRKGRKPSRRHQMAKGQEDREHILTCVVCGQSFDMRDLQQLRHHEQEMHKPLPRH